MQDVRIMNLSELLSRATPYERWRAPIHPALRRATIIAAPTILVGLVVTWATPWMLAFAASDFFIVFGDFVRQVLGIWYRLWHVVVIVDCVSLIAFGFLFWKTNALEVGRPIYHWSALVEVLIGVANALVMVLGLSIVLINVVAWILIFGVCIVIMSAVLGE
jgi:hypothetical protein